jgi:outer membrane protein assembly factor BamA
VVLGLHFSGTMRLFAILTVFLIGGVAGVIHSLPRADAQTVTIATTQEVHSIAIDESTGRGLPLAQLREVISTELGQPVDAARLEQDRAALQSWLSARGYLAAKVAAPIVTFGKTGGAYIVFDIARGPLFHVGEVTLEGAHWSHAGVVTIATGDDAVGDRLERARQAAEDTLARHGTPVHVELVLQPSTQDALLDVRFVTR